jgi:hypothetical protein
MISKIPYAAITFIYIYTLLATGFSHSPHSLNGNVTTHFHQIHTNYQYANLINSCHHECQQKPQRLLMLSIIADLCLQHTRRMSISKIRQRPVL